eukprot:3182681-Amphidinium_carterae.2
MPQQVTSTFGDMHDVPLGCFNLVQHVLTACAKRTGGVDNTDSIPTCTIELCQEPRCTSGLPAARTR